MKFKFFAAFFTHVGRNSYEVDLSSVKQGRFSSQSVNLFNIIEYLEKNHPGFRELILDNGKLKSMVNILKNGHNILHLEGLNTLVTNEDQLVFFPPAGGG